MASQKYHILAIGNADKAGTGLPAKGHCDLTQMVKFFETGRITKFTMVDCDFNPMINITNTKIYCENITPELFASIIDNTSELTIVLDFSENSVESALRRTNFKAFNGRVSYFCLGLLHIPDQEGVIANANPSGIHVTPQLVEHCVFAILDHGPVIIGLNNESDFEWFYNELISYKRCIHQDPLVNYLACFWNANTINGYCLSNMNIDLNVRLTLYKWAKMIANIDVNANKNHKKQLMDADMNDLLENNEVAWQSLQASGTVLIKKLNENLPPVPEMWRC